MGDNEYFTFRSYTATVLEVRSWSETHISGGGDGIAATPIRTSSRQRHVAWLRDDTDGQEFESELTAVRLPCRPGHKLSFLHGTAKRKPEKEQLLAIYNHSTHEWRDISEGVVNLISLSVKTSITLLVLWPIAFFIGNLDVVDLTRGDKIFVPLLIMTVLSMTVSYLRHKKPRLQLDDLIKQEKKKIESSVVSSSHVSAEEIRVSPQMA